MYTAVQGQHRAPLAPHKLRELAQAFLDADFYSMDDKYEAGITDLSTYTLSINIDGKEKRVVDYAGAAVGMPAVIAELEKRVDETAGSNRWVNGGDGLADALAAEDFSFRSPEAQHILSISIARGSMPTVQQMLRRGTPLDSIDPQHPAPGWLESANRQEQILRLLIDRKASEHNQQDKDIALYWAVRETGLSIVRMLLDYGANVNAELSRYSEHLGPSIVVSAASCENPEIMREVLRYNPSPQERGKALVFAAESFIGQVNAKTRLACVTMLLDSGADPKARGFDGLTALHTAKDAKVTEILLARGADVNAQDDKGRTPLMMAANPQIARILVMHGADVSVRNERGEDVLQADATHSPEIAAAIREALREKESIR
ncbi:MAG: ankyrin repeat domain-containing protein [Acidobacteria bacterium]|nr:ankyrin repeat domain-containing protein [Acidobacteriota bacterium]